MSLTSQQRNGHDRRSTTHHQYVSSPDRPTVQFDFDIYLFLSDIRNMVASVMLKLDRLETKLDSKDKSEERKREPQESNSHHQTDRSENLLLYFASLIIMLLLMYLGTQIDVHHIDVNHIDNM